MPFSNPEETNAVTPSTRGRILVIDDEIGPRESLRMVLKDSYELVCTDCGESGVEKFKEGGFDLVMLDLKMKKLSGIETLEKLKEIDPFISVIILTGYGTLDTAQKAIRLGANDYLSKPFDVVELAKTVNRILAKGREDRQRETALHRFKALNRYLEEEIQSLQKLLSSQEQYRSFFHEICNPLTSVLGYVQILLLELEGKKEFGMEDKERAHKYLRIIENEMERCRLMLRSFSSIAKKREEKPQPISLKALVEEIFVLLSPQMDRNGIRGETRADTTSSAVLVQSNEIRQVLLNLCINAIHAMDRGGTLTVGTRCTPHNFLEIEVADTGCGMDEATLKKAFEPFFTTKGPQVGSGLGLAISKNIIERFGGTIGISSIKGAGTKVIFSVPVKSPL